MYLLDTNVVSELRKPRPHGAVLAWIASVDDAHPHLSAITIAGIQAGIEIIRDQDAAKAAEIDAWLGLVAASYNVLPMDAMTFRAWAKLMHRRSETFYEEGMVAATAQVHNLTVVKWNVGNFRPFGMNVFNPFRTAPDSP